MINIIIIIIIIKYVIGSSIVKTLQYGSSLFLSLFNSQIMSLLYSRAAGSSQTDDQWSNNDSTTSRWAAIL